MPILPLAMEIARIVSGTARFEDGLEGAADALLAAHPEAEVTRDQLIEALHEEAAAAGVLAPNPS